MNSPLHIDQSQTYPVDELLISHSTMSSYSSCPRKLEFTKLYGFNLRKPNLAGDGGNALHEAVGEYIITKDKSLAILKLMLSYPIDLCDNPMWKWSLEASYACLISTINYLEEHTELEIATINGKPAIEVAFLIKIKHNIEGLMPVVYRGYIDFVFYNRLDNTYFVMDLKNTTWNLADFTPVYKYSPQCLPYALVLARALDRDFDNLHVEYLISKVDIMEAKTFVMEFNKTKQDVEEWTRDLWMELMNIKTYIDTKWWPRRSGSCIAFNRTCNFFELCQSRKMKTIKLMLSSLDQPEAKPFTPDIVLDLEIV